GPLDLIPERGAKTRRSIVFPPIGVSMGSMMDGFARKKFSSREKFSWSWQAILSEEEITRR
ncbi:MAG: hypothetical protein ACP5XB_03185, partial [Isosphaeraceae bacterium]